MKPADQDPHCFPRLLKMHAYNWNAVDKQDKHWGGVWYKIFSMARVKKPVATVLHLYYWLINKILAKTCHSLSYLMGRSIYIVFPLQQSEIAIFPFTLHMFVLFCMSDLILYVPSKILQL